MIDADHEDAPNSAPDSAPTAPPEDDPPTAPVPPLPAKLEAVAARPPAKLPERIQAFRELGWWLANAEGTRTPLIASCVRFTSL